MGFGNGLRDLGKEEENCLVIIGWCDSHMAQVAQQFHCSLGQHEGPWNTTESLSPSMVQDPQKWQIPERLIFFLMLPRVALESVCQQLEQQRTYVMWHPLGPQSQASSAGRF